MIDVIKLTIGNITYPNVKVLSTDDIIDAGMEPMFGDNTIMFRNGRDWHAVHGFRLTLMQVSTTQLKIPGMIPFKRLVIDSDKIYDNGKFAPYGLLQRLELEGKWKIHMTDEIAFSCPDGAFISSSWDVTNIIMPEDSTKTMTSPLEMYTMTAARGISQAAVKKLDELIKKGGTKSCRSAHPNRRHSVVDGRKQ